MRRFLALFRKEFLQIRRDPLSLRLLFILPVLQTLVLGYAMTRDVRNIALGIVDLDRSEASISLAQRIATNGRFVFRGAPPDAADAHAGLLRGDFLAVVVLPEGFGRDLERQQRDGDPPERPVRVQVALDGQDASTGATAASYIGQIVSQWGRERLAREMVAQGFDARALQPFEVRESIAWNPELDFSWSMIPGMVILLVTMVGALLTSFSLVRERENGTLEQLLVTPVLPVQVLLGKSLPYWILSQVVFWIALGINGLWFGLPIGGTDLLALELGLALYALTSVALGILISTIVSSQQQALFLLWFFLIFFILTSGFLLPLESMPSWMLVLTEGNAVRHFLYIARALVLRGADPASLVGEYLKLAAIGSTLFLAAVLAFRRKAA